jgi:hypothetical protein
MFLPPPLVLEWVGMNLKEQALVKAVQEFESIGFMEWHARVLKELTVTPQSFSEISHKTGLFQYYLRGVMQDLLALQLVEYTRYGIQLSDEWGMLFQLVECCEGNPQKACYDWEAAFEVVTPKVVALKQKYKFGE